MIQQPHIVNRLKNVYTQVDLMFGTHNIHHLPQLIEQVVFDEKRIIEVFSKETVQKYLV